MHTTRSDITGISKAIAAYIRTLHPMSSVFDRYMQGGPDSLLTTRQKRGANLFMGRAQCATCHFIPLFNGLIPPDYALTEFEVLGTTRTGRPGKPQVSRDQGRYNVYPFPFYKGAFKTPTVRNAAVTAPYMHNGAFRSLDSVLEFYNRGGGQGLGLNVPSQTLSSHPLGLSSKEKQDIIQFIYALTDAP
jgi:cytochrome c peroxidase